MQDYFQAVRCLNEAVEILVGSGIDIGPLVIVERFEGHRNTWSGASDGLRGEVFSYGFVHAADPKNNVATYMPCMDSLTLHGVQGSGRHYGIPIKETYDISGSISRARDLIPIFSFPD